MEAIASGVFNVKLASPEAFKDSIVISSKLTFALAFRPQHTDCGERKIPYFACSKNYQFAFAGLSPTVHVRVANCRLRNFSEWSVVGPTALTAT